MDDATLFFVIELIPFNFGEVKLFVGAFRSNWNNNLFDVDLELPVDCGKSAELASVMPCLISFEQFKQMS